MHLPALAGLSAASRQGLMKNASVAEAPTGTAILRAGEKSDAAYFVLDGRAVAGVEEGGRERVLEVMNPGDFFGEIAALTGVSRTANVVSEQPTTLLQVHASALRSLMADPTLSRLILSKMTERLNRSLSPDLPRLAGIDQQALHDLRTAQS